MDIEFGRIVQHGYIVKDVEAAAAEWNRRVGAGPFYILERIAMDKCYFRGVRTELELRLGFGYWGGIQIELIQLLNHSDTIFGRVLQRSVGKLNHFSAVVPDLDGLLARRKFENRVMQSGRTPSGLKFAYLEEYLPGGLHLKLLEAHASTLAVFAGMERISRQWDGQNPVRPLSSLQQDLTAR